jgi:carbon-monoxide dehydrogenase medium subunit
VRFSRAALDLERLYMLSGFDLVRPMAVSEASQLLQQYGEAARLYAGGTELLLLLRQGLVRYEQLVDVKQIDRLQRLSWDGARLRVGAAVTHRRVERAPEVAERLPLLVEVERQIANVRVRNVGTLGGNLAFGEPHSDPGTLLLLYDTQLSLGSTRGERMLGLDAFFQGPYQTALEPDELLVEVAVAPLSVGWQARYRRFGHYERPSVGVAVALRSTNGTVDEARVAVGCVASRPMRLPFLEERLTGARGSEIPALLNELGSRLRSELEPISDLHGSDEYKLHLTRVLLGRTVVTILHDQREGSSGH